MKFKYLVAIAAVIALTASALATVERTCCIEDHGGPLEGVPPDEAIGKVAGYTVFTLFLDDGGYGLDQSAKDQIETWNTEYQENEYDPRQDDATAIWAWLDARHDGIGSGSCAYCNDFHASMTAWEAERDGKIGDLHDLDAGIDAVWAELADDIRALILDEDYTDFLDAH